MERGPEIRIIGGASKEKKDQVKEKIEQSFFNNLESLNSQDRERLEELECPKSEKELALIDFINQETSRLMQEAEVSPYDIPAENYHIIPSELYDKIGEENSSAVTLNTSQAIFFNAKYFHGNPFYFGAVALHESLHLKAHFSVEVQENDGNLRITPYREGLAIRALQRDGYNGNYHIHFSGLHEGIVAETEKKLLGKLLDCPVLFEEKEWLTSNEAKEIRQKISKEEDIPEDDIIWVSGKDRNDYESVSYPKQREVLNYICTEIQKEFPDKYSSAEAVYKTFLNAHFTGRLLNIAHLVEKTFGEGSFRLLGNMDTSRESGASFLETLKENRLKQL